MGQTRKKGKARPKVTKPADPLSSIPKPPSHSTTDYSKWDKIADSSDEEEDYEPPVSDDEHGPPGFHLPGRCLECDRRAAIAAAEAAAAEAEHERKKARSILPAQSKPSQAKPKTSGPATKVQATKSPAAAKTAPVSGPGKPKQAAASSFGFSFDKKAQTSKQGTGVPPKKSVEEKMEMYSGMRAAANRMKANPNSRETYSETVDGMDMSIRAARPEDLLMFMGGEGTTFMGGAMGRRPDGSTFSHTFGNLPDFFDIDDEEEDEDDDDEEKETYQLVHPSTLKPKSSAKKPASAPAPAAKAAAKQPTKAAAKPATKAATQPASSATKGPPQAGAKKSASSASSAQGGNQTGANGVQTGTRTAGKEMKDMSGALSSVVDYKKILKEFYPGKSESEMEEIIFEQFMKEREQLEKQSEVETVASQKRPGSAKANSSYVVPKTAEEIEAEKMAERVLKEESEEKARQAEKLEQKRLKKLEKKQAKAERQSQQAKNESKPAFSFSAGALPNKAEAKTNQSSQKQDPQKSSLLQNAPSSTSAAKSGGNGLSLREQLLYGKSNGMGKAAASKPEPPARPAHLDSFVPDSLKQTKDTSSQSKAADSKKSKKKKGKQQAEREMLALASRAEEYFSEDQDQSMSQAEEFSDEDDQQGSREAQMYSHRVQELQSLPSSSPQGPPAAGPSMPPAQPRAQSHSEDVSQQGPEVDAEEFSDEELDEEFVSSNPFEILDAKTKRAAALNARKLREDRDDANEQTKPPPGRQAELDRGLQSFAQLHLSEEGSESGTSQPSEPRRPIPTQQPSNASRDDLVRSSKIPYTNGFAPIHQVNEARAVWTLLDNALQDEDGAMLGPAIASAKVWCQKHQGSRVFLPIVTEMRKKVDLASKLAAQGPSPASSASAPGPPEGLPTRPAPTQGHLAPFQQQSANPVGPVYRPPGPAPAQAMGPGPGRGMAPRPAFGRGPGMYAVRGPSPYSGRGMGSTGGRGPVPAAFAHHAPQRIVAHQRPPHPLSFSRVEDDEDPNAVFDPFGGVPMRPFRGAEEMPPYRPISAPRPATNGSYAPPRQASPDPPELEEFFFPVTSQKNLRAQPSLSGPQLNNQPTDDRFEHMTGREVDDETLCVICMDRPINVILDPCEHSLMCSECAAIVKEHSGLCPTCRGQIMAVLEFEP